MKTWRIHLLDHPMDGVRRPQYFNERDRRLKSGEEERLLAAAFEEDEKWSQNFCHDQLVAAEFEGMEGGPSRYRFWQTRKQLLNEAQATWVHIPMYESFVQFQLMTGARRGESLSLLWSDVDLDAQTAFLPETKNGRSRKLPLRSALVELLRQLPRSGEHVFEFTNAALRNAWKRICERAGLIGINELHVHDLSHEAISRVAEIGSNTPGGFSLLDLQAFSGHRDVRMLLRYAHLCAQGLAKRLDEAFSSSTKSVTRHGRKRLTAEAKISIKNIVDGEPPNSDDGPCTVPQEPSVRLEASTVLTTPTTVEAKNVIHVDFRRQAA